MKLQTKERDGSKVRRTYDQAQTPMQRLLAVFRLNIGKAARATSDRSGIGPDALADPTRTFTQGPLAARSYLSGSADSICCSAPVFRASRYRREGSS
jgi:hypothetical protein